MISAPLRPTQTKSTETKSMDMTHSIKTQGHLALLEWEETLLAAAPQPFGLRRRSVMDRCYDGGTVMLLAVSVVALAASLCRF